MKGLLALLVFCLVCSVSFGEGNYPPCKDYGKDSKVACHKKKKRTADCNCGDNCPCAPECDCTDTAKQTTEDPCEDCDSCKWVVGVDGSQIHLMCDGKQVGTWNYTTRHYYSYNGETWTRSKLPKSAPAVPKRKTHQAPRQEPVYQESQTLFYNQGISGGGFFFGGGRSRGGCSGGG